MRGDQEVPVLFYVAAGALAGAITFWGVFQLWQVAGELDEAGPRHNMTRTLKRHKTEAMQQLLDAVVVGRLDEVEEAAGRMEASATSIGTYLMTDAYREHGEAFVDALQAVQQAAHDGDIDAAEAATLRLEASCIGCHRTIRQSAKPADGGGGL